MINKNILGVLFALFASSFGLSATADEIKVLLKPAPGVTQKGVIVGERLWLVSEDGVRKLAADGKYPTNDGQINVVGGKVADKSYGGTGKR
jgi:hypothetical protein